MCPRLIERMHVDDLVLVDDDEEEEEEEEEGQGEAYK